jgi:hypothetical protein
MDVPRFVIDPLLSYLYFSLGLVSATVATLRHPREARAIAPNNELFLLEDTLAL